MTGKKNTHTKKNKNFNAIKTHTTTALNPATISRAMSATARYMRRRLRFGGAIKYGATMTLPRASANAWAGIPGITEAVPYIGFTRPASRPSSPLNSGFHVTWSIE